MIRRCTNLLDSRMFSELVTDALTERTYDADLAGLSYALHSRLAGLSVSVSGYSDKISLLLETILTEMRSIVINPQRFEIIKEQVRSVLIVRNRRED